MDPKSKFSKMGLFLQGWKKLYGYESENAMIEWHGQSDEAGIASLNAKDKSMINQFGDTIKADVLNVIPPQKAGKIAFTAGLTNDKGWCPVRLDTFESTIHKDIHVIGDAAIATGLPKSGYAANSEAKVCAVAVSALLNGTSQEPPLSSTPVIPSLAKTTVYQSQPSTVLLKMAVKSQESLVD